MTDIEIIKAAQSAARVYFHGERPTNTDQAAIDAYQTDALSDPVFGVRRDQWKQDQELLYRLAFGWQLIALGL